MRIGNSTEHRIKSLLKPREWSVVATDATFVRTLGRKRGLLGKTSAMLSRKAAKTLETNARVVTITRRRTLLIDGPLQHRRFIQRTLIVRHGSWGSPFQ
jgi:hypothetical protein